MQLAFLRVFQDILKYGHMQLGVFRDILKYGHMQLGVFQDILKYEHNWDILDCGNYGI